MIYVNQLEYDHIPYRTNVMREDFTDEQKMRSVRKSGCGLCCVCTMLSILTEHVLPVEECVKISEECIANHSTGTDMKVLGPVIAEKFGIDYKGSNDVEEVIRHLQRGGQVICHVGVPEGESIGLFTKGGHYICLIATDGEQFCILDPSYTPEKFTIPERAGRINTDHAPYLYCHKEIVHSETRRNRPFKYHLFARKGGFSAI